MEWHQKLWYIQCRSRTFRVSCFTFRVSYFWPGLITTIEYYMHVTLIAISHFYHGNILATNLGSYCCHGALAYLHKLCETRNAKHTWRTCKFDIFRWLKIEGVEMKLVNFIRKSKLKIEIIALFRRNLYWTAIEQLWWLAVPNSILWLVVTNSSYDWFSLTAQKLTHQGKFLVTGLLNDWGLQNMYSPYWFNNRSPPYNAGSVTCHA